MSEISFSLEKTNDILLPEPELLHSTTVTELEQSAKAENTRSNGRKHTLILSSNIGQVSDKHTLIKNTLILADLHMYHAFSAGVSLKH